MVSARALPPPPPPGLWAQVLCVFVCVCVCVCLCVVIKTRMRACVRMNALKLRDIEEIPLCKMHVHAMISVSNSRACPGKSLALTGSETAVCLPEILYHVNLCMHDLMRLGTLHERGTHWASIGCISVPANTMNTIRLPQKSVLLA